MPQITTGSPLSRTNSIAAGPDTSIRIGDRTLAEWDRDWVQLPGGLHVRHRSYNNKVGLIRLKLRGRDMYIGAAAAREGGIAKRISDFTRPSDSGRNHHAGLLIHANADLLDVEVLVTGTGFRAGAVAERLKPPMIWLHDPFWNAPELVVARARALTFAQSDRS